MPWSNQAVSLIILTEAAHGFSGLFGYSPAPGRGNLIFSIAAAPGTDPFGNTYPAGLSTTAGSGTIEGTNYIINAAGAFFYSGTPALGNLIASIASGAGTDSFGNAYLSALVSYDNVDGTTARIGGGALSFTGTAFTTLQNGSSAGTVFREPVNARQPGGTGPEVWHTVTGMPAGWSGAIRYKLLATGQVLIDFQVTVASGTVITHGEQIGTLPVGYYYPSDAKLLALNSSTSGVSSNAPAQISSAGAIQWIGGAVTPSASLFWYGQAIYAVDV